MNRLSVLALLAVAACGGVSSNPIDQGSGGDSARLTDGHVADDLAAPDMSAGDAAVPSDAAVPACGDADVMTSVDNCGACGHVCTAPAMATATCTLGQCGYDVDATTILKWTANGGDRSLALWQDGTVNAGPVQIAPSGVATPYSIPAYEWDRRLSIWIQNGVSKSLLSHQQGVNAWSEDATMLWTGTSAGCCDYFFDRAVAIDPAGGFGYYGNWVLNLGNGSTVTTLPGLNGYNFLAGQTLFQVAGGTIASIDLAQGTLRWMKTVETGNSPPQIGPAAIAADGTLVAVAPTGSLLHLAADGSNVFAPVTVTAPAMGTATPQVVLAGAGEIVVNTGDPGLAAYGLGDGAQRWSHALPGVVYALLAADDGVIYAYLPTRAAVVGVDAATGTERYHFTSAPGGQVGAPAELLLRDGVLYALGGGSILAFPAPAMHYDPASSWPVPFHDNQRTCDRDGPLTY